MSISKKGTPTVGAEYPAQNPTTTETVPTIYASASAYLHIADVLVLRITAKRINVVVCLSYEAEQYWPTYTLDRADLEAGKPCSRKFALRKPTRKGELLEFTTSRHIIEFSFIEAVASAASSMGHDLDESISRIYWGELALAELSLQKLILLGAQIPADNPLRLNVKTLATVMDSIPVPEEIPTVD